VRATPTRNNSDAPEADAIEIAETIRAKRSAPRDRCAYVGEMTA
jgi:hypothetical protein